MFQRQPIIDLIKKRQFSASLGASARYLQPLEDSVESGEYNELQFIIHDLRTLYLISDVFMIGSMEVPREEPDREAQDELEMKEAEKLQQQLQQQRREPPPPSETSLEDEFQQIEEHKMREEEERKRREEELRLQEEMMAEIEMMQREKENWAEEKKTLEKGKAEITAEKETLEQ